VEADRKWPAARRQRRVVLGGLAKIGRRRT
jgi:hypothetical protein